MPRLIYQMLAALCIAINAWAVPIPQLDLSLENSHTVKLEIRPKPDPSGKKKLRAFYKKATLEIERSVGFPTNFRVLSQLVAPKRVNLLVDQITPGSIVEYRVRISKGKNQSRWTSDVAPYEDPSIFIGSGAPYSAANDYPLPEGASDCDQGLRDTMIRLINFERTIRNIPALSPNQYLEQAARNHAIYMAQIQVMTHQDFVWAARIYETGYTGNYVSQNIAKEYTDPSDVVSGWMGSAGHAANLLHTSANGIGVGCIIDSNGVYWWAEDMGQ